MLFLMFLSVFMITVLDGQQVSGPTHGKKVVCHMAAYATYRPKLGSFDQKHLDPSLCTHLVYSYALLNETTNSIMSNDRWLDIQKNNGMTGYRSMVALKQQYPHLHVTIAIGGWTDGSVTYSNMASSPETRKTFIQSVLNFLKEYKFDGLVLVWQYPTERGGVPQDREKLAYLVQELHEAFQPHGYTLTAALSSVKYIIDKAYDLTKLNQYLDMVHVLAYDYHGTWDGFIGATAPLKGLDEDDVFSVEFTLNHLIANGVSPSKLVLGLPFYGHTFILKNPEEREIEFGRSLVKDKGFKGPYTNQDDFMGYNEICMELELTNSSSSWSYHWHEQSATPYIRDGVRVICYDNARSIAAKVKVAVDKGLGGFMLWSLDTDDFRGLCSQEKDAYLDFSDRMNEINNNPELKEVLKSLNLPDADALSNTTSYVISNGKLNLQLLATDKPVKYKLLRTINEATSLAIQERRILDEVERLTKEHEKLEGVPEIKIQVTGNGKDLSCTGTAPEFELNSPFLVYLNHSEAIYRVRCHKHDDVTTAVVNDFRKEPLSKRVGYLSTKTAIIGCSGHWYFACVVYTNKCERSFSANYCYYYENSNSIVQDKGIQCYVQVHVQ